MTALVNEAPARPEEPLIGLANEITAGSGDGWAIIPYGEHRNERGLQRFGRPEAEQMVGYFRNSWNRIKRAFVGMPVLRGHPDFVDTLRRERDRRAKAGLPTGEAQAMINEALTKWPDATVYGTIADLEVRDTGLALKPILTEAGAALVNEGLKYFSPHWLALDLPPEGDAPVKAPVFLVSIGLTDRPNIAGTSLVNTAPDRAAPAQPTQPVTTMPPWILELLGLVNTAPDQQEPQVRERLTALLARPEPTALVNEQSARTSAETRLTELTTALANERSALATARTERNAALVEVAVKLGHIAEATRPVWLGRLERDFATESAALVNERSGPKTKPVTDALGQRKPAAEAGAQFTALVNERCAKTGEAYTVAWAAVKGTPEGKALIAKMETAAAA